MGSYSRFGDCYQSVVYGESTRVCFTGIWSKRLRQWKMWKNCICLTPLILTWGNFLYTNNYRKISVVIKCPCCNRHIQKNDSFQFLIPLVPESEGWKISGTLWIMSMQLIFIGGCGILSGSVINSGKFKANVCVWKCESFSANIDLCEKYRVGWSKARLLVKLNPRLRSALCVAYSNSN